MMALRELPRTKVNDRLYVNNDKSIIFIGTHHLGKAEYYETLKEEIKQHKENGYQVYYEMVNNPEGLDSLSLDSLNRKIRRVFGFMPSVDFYDSSTNGTILESLVPQPENKDLGIDSLDINADITTLNLLNYYESNYGKVELTNDDFDIPLNRAVSRKAKYSQIFEMTIDYRNIKLAEIICKSDNNKILIIYGLGHRKGFLKELRLLDENWKKRRF